MNIMTKRGSLDNIITYEHFCDTKADLANIPKDQITLGSIAVVLRDDGDEMGIYIAGSNKEWVVVSTSSGSGAGGATTLELIHICSNNEYNSSTGLPTIQEPEENTIYFVPNEDEETNNLFDEYIYVNDEWEKIGNVETNFTVPTPDWDVDTYGQSGYIDNKPAIKAGTGTSSILEASAAAANGPYSHAEGYETTASGPQSHAEGYETIASEAQSHAEGYETTASGTQSHAEGANTTASELQSHAEGNGTAATGYASHAEGANTTASGPVSHAEGNGTKASGAQSHAEGGGTKASGPYSHAEGANTTASGPVSHAEGSNTIASGPVSHAEGYGTTANHASQHVFGEYNIADSSAEAATKRGDYVEIVGNGTKNDARSNARTLDWSGNESLAGNLTLGKGTVDETTITAAQLKGLLSLTSANGVSF